MAAVEHGRPVVTRPDGNERVYLGGVSIGLIKRLTKCIRQTNVHSGTHAVRVTGEQAVIIGCAGELIEQNIAKALIRAEEVSGENGGDASAGRVVVLRIEAQKVGVERSGIDVPLPEQVTGERAGVTDGDKIRAADLTLDIETEVVSALLVTLAGERTNTAVRRE